MPVYLGRELAHRFGAASQKVAFQVEVLGRVAGDAELAEDDEVGALILRAGDPLAHKRGVLLHGSNRGVDLGQREC